MPRIDTMWSLEERWPRETTDQPACGLMEAHDMHRHETMNRHFKMKAVWCNGVCQWCFQDGVPEDIRSGRTPAFGRGLHGNGAHK